MDFWLKQTREALENTDMNEMRIREKVHTGIKTRLQLEVPYLKVWPQAMILGAQPANTLNTFQKIHEISDEVWHQAGDKSIDVSNSFILCDNVNNKKLTPVLSSFIPLV